MTAVLVHPFLDELVTVLVRISLRLTSRASGQSLDMRLANIFTLRDGRITELDVYYKDPSGVSDLLRPSQP